MKSQINRDRTRTSGEERPSTEKHVHQLRSTTSFIVSVEDLFGGKKTSQDILVLRAQQ